MNKKVYEVPSLNVINTEVTDIICTSGGEKLTTFSTTKLMDLGKIDAE